MKVTEQRTAYLLLRIFDGEVNDINAVILILDEKTKEEFMTCLTLKRKLGTNGFERLEFKNHNAHFLSIDGRKEQDMVHWLEEVWDFRYLDATEEEIKTLIEQYEVYVEQSTFSLYASENFRFSVIYDADGINNNLEMQTWSAPISAIVGV